jgi:proteasome lid subunit RPN8/RPN11
VAGDPGRAIGVNPGTFRLTQSQYNTVVAHCYDGYPNEACGLFVGTMMGGEPSGFVSEARPCRNAADSSLVYTVDSRDLMGAMRAAESAGHEVVGCWHSHTHTDPYPSPTDVEQAKWYPDWVYVIVSLKYDAPVMNAYRIVDGVIHDIPIAIERG